MIDWLSSVLRPLQHSIGYIMGDGFYRSKDPTNSIKVLKENFAAHGHDQQGAYNKYTVHYKIAKLRCSYKVGLPCFTAMLVTAPFSALPPLTRSHFNQIYHLIKSYCWENVIYVDIHPPMPTTYPAASRENFAKPPLPRKSGLNRKYAAKKIAAKPTRKSWLIRLPEKNLLLSVCLNSNKKVQLSLTNPRDAV